MVKYKEGGLQSPSWGERSAIKREDQKASFEYCGFPFDEGFPQRNWEKSYTLIMRSGSVIHYAYIVYHYGKIQWVYNNRYITYEAVAAWAEEEPPEKLPYVDERAERVLLRCPAAGSMTEVRHEPAVSGDYGVYSQPSVIQRAAGITAQEIVAFGDQKSDYDQLYLIQMFLDELLRAELIVNLDYSGNYQRTQLGDHYVAVLEEYKASQNRV